MPSKPTNMLAIAVIALFGAFACHVPKIETKNLYIVKVYGERVGSEFKPELRSIRQTAKPQDLKSTPGLVFEYIDTEGKSHQSPCAHSCFMGHIANVKPLPANSPGMVFECEWVAIFRISRPMKSFKIINNGVTVLEGHPNLKKLLYEHPKP